MTGTPPEDFARFLREAKILRSLDHPNIVAFRDVGEASGRLFFAMDFVQGTDAAALLRGGPLPVRRAVGFVAQVLEALAYAHDKRFVHRDVKPANMLVEEGTETVKVADFGLARVYHSSTMSGLTMTHHIGGTPAFMPPEQITNFREALPSADQYSAAASLYNLLSNRAPFDARTQQELLGKIMAAAPVPIQTRQPNVPPGLAEVIHKALAKEPAKRFPDVRALRAALLPYET